MVKSLEPKNESGTQTTFQLQDSISSPSPGYRQRIPWKRLGWAMGFIGLGMGVLALGASSIGYRLTHIVVDTGMVNGRVVRLRSPISGSISDFYAQPGVQVEAQQVLARVVRNHQGEQNLLTLEGNVQAKASQLQAATDSLTFLKQQLRQLETEHRSLQTVEAGLATDGLAQHEARVEQAVTQANAAQLDYERYNSLLIEGAVTQQDVDQLKAVWESREAQVRQAQAALSAAKAEAQALEGQTIANRYETLGNSLVMEAAALRQQIQSQTTLVNTLQMESRQAEQQLEQAQSLYSDRQDLEILAPFAGVIYRTNLEQNERVNESEPVLSLLDCNEIWVEAVLPARQVSQIDLQMPVSVDLKSVAEPLAGEVDLIQPLSGVQSGIQPAHLTQVQALPPVIPPQLAGQPLKRVTVRIPPPTNHDQTQQFCGVGQSVRLVFAKSFAQ
ncbi:MAG: HlyD family efflux transporter periplasmic adaptor subunit [Synechococcales bacterium]|nr:HlyD family efflux transporter periplasmic adaptor subunit [Synechococcales bacterium]